MKILSAIMYAAIAISVASCGAASVRTEPAQSSQEQNPDAPRRQPVFSIFDNTGRDGCHIYRNGERIATMNLDSGRSIIGMRAYKGDCYTLMSRWKSDTAVMPAEIFKNGHPAMAFLPEFRAAAFDMCDGHFYTLGVIDTSAITVYRDGLRALTMPLSYGAPKAVCVMGQDIYVAIQRGGSGIMIARNGKRLMDIPGHLEDFKVSEAGCYTMADGILYRDSAALMSRATYEYSGVEMTARPRHLAVSGPDCYVSAVSTISGAKHYASLFKNDTAMQTFKPDSKPLGESAFQTFCTGVAACQAGVYSAIYRADSAGNAAIPMVYHFHFNTEETFSIDFGESSARMLFVESSQL